MTELEFWEACLLTVAPSFPCQKGRDRYIECKTFADQSVNAWKALRKECRDKRRSIEADRERLNQLRDMKLPDEDLLGELKQELLELEELEANGELDE